MAEVKYNVCDMCGRRLDTPRKWKMIRVTKVALSYRTPNPYDYGDYAYELCRDCGQAVYDFIHAPRPSGTENGGTGNELSTENH